MRRHAMAGLTLLETLIVAVVLAILIAVALPRYLASIDHARQAEAEEHLHNIRNAQFRYFQDHATYASDGSLLALEAWPPGGRYTYCITSADATDFQAVAQPTSGSAPHIAIHKEGVVAVTAAACP